MSEEKSNFLKNEEANLAFSESNMTRTHFGETKEIKELQRKEESIFLLMKDIERNKKEVLLNLVYIFEERERLFSVPELEHFKDRFHLYLASRLGYATSSAGNATRVIKLLSDHQRQDLLKKKEGEEGYNSDCMYALQKIASIPSKEAQAKLLDDFSSWNRNTLKALSKPEKKKTIKKKQMEIDGLNIKFDKSRGRVALTTDKKWLETNGEVLQKLVTFLRRVDEETLNDILDNQIT